LNLDIVPAVKTGFALGLQATHISDYFQWQRGLVFSITFGNGTKQLVLSDVAYRLAPAFMTTFYHTITSKDFSPHTNRPANTVIERYIIWTLIVFKDYCTACAIILNGFKRDTLIHFRQFNTYRRLKIPRIYARISEPQHGQRYHGSGRHTLTANATPRTTRDLVQD
jgi:hypothetical protein